MRCHFFAVAAILSVVQASPTRRQLTDNGFCSQLIATCLESSNELTDPWSVEACIFGATCIGGQHPVDDLLITVASGTNQTAPSSRNLPRVSQAVFDKISTDGEVITQQNFIDSVYGTLAKTKGPFPDVSFVISDYRRVTNWTMFCNDQGVPYKNFADYYQFSSAVSSPGCPAPMTTISNEPSCQKQFAMCVAAVNSSVSDAWNHPSCLFSAMCIGGQRQVDTLLSLVWENKTKKPSGAPTSLQQRRLSTETMQVISTDGGTITQQNWIDAYYGRLAVGGGPFPADASIVTDEFIPIASWTGFCSGGIPFTNVADYFEFSSTVSTSGSLC